MTPDAGLAVLVGEGDPSTWTPLLEFGPDDSLSSGPIGFVEDGRALLAQSSAGVNASRLVSVNLATGDQTVIAEDPIFDVVNAILHPDTHQPQVVIFANQRRSKTMSWRRPADI